ncbi:serine hydrolase [Streptomyces sp. F-1]|uniref:serine hydrolase n=1 Tax=Streptomyces sp. F-1 TaxID=463642 RepID=UPI000869AD18|nr:serine hydrolase [Streptomyces sp. F-1]SFY48167.1 Putative lipoprotein LppW [Streptomyces sp. F-1]
MSSHPPRTARRTAGVLLATVTALLAAGVPAATAATPAPAPKPSQPTPDPTPSSPKPSRSAPAAKPSGPAAPAPKPSEPPAPVSDPHATAAVLDLDAGGDSPVVHGPDRAYDTASIVKVDILATLLLQAQDAHRSLTDEERGHAEPMIRRSDNASADALWREIGRAPGLEAANKRLGLTSTTGGSGGRWGLTRTTASDQIRLLRAVFDDTTPSALTPASRAYIRTLMGEVLPEQSWGVSAVDAAGATTKLKNGWLERSATRLWDVNSVGAVTVDGHRCLVAVLSDGSASMDAGVSLVERTAREAVS